MHDLNTLVKVSIILPTYNRAAYIIETIESIRRQTYPNWELLIIDDGSQDNTEELIRQIKDERIQLHKTGTRLGITGTRYEGMKKATGELIAFIDSDDLWAPAKLEKQLAAFQQYPEAAFSLTGGYNFRKLDEPLQYFYKQREGLRYGDILVALFQSEAAATMPSLIMKKKCLQVMDNVEQKDSIDVILDLASHFKAIILYEPLFYRRLHDTNYSSLNWKKRHYEGLEMLSSYRSSLPPKVFRDALFRSHINFGEKCLLYKERRKALHQFFGAWKKKPFSTIPLRKIGKVILSAFRK